MEGKKYGLRILNKYVNQGRIEKINHSYLPISIYNYTRETQFKKDWDEVTLNMRGTVIDRQGYVIASGFEKFFNYEEVSDNLPDRSDYVYIQEKIDGSLGILFYYEGEWHLTTKGAFDSDIAKKGMEILKKQYKFFDQMFMTHVTYIVEIISTENKLVVNYKNKEKIVFLSTSIKGIEQHWTTSLSIFKGSGIKKSDIIKTEQHFNFSKELFNELKSLNTPNKEGFVIIFQPYFRMKIKFENYVSQHKLITEFSSIDIWKGLRDGKDFDTILNQVPDEFDKWVRERINKIELHKCLIEQRCEKIYQYFKYGKYGDKEIQPTKKQFVEHLEFCKVQPEIKSICLSMWDGLKYDKVLWRLVKPKYEAPFWKK